MGAVVQTGRLGGGRAPGRPDADADRGRGSTDRWNGVHRGRRRATRHSHRRLLPRRRTKRTHAQQRVVVLAGHRKRTDPDRRRRARRPPRARVVDTPSSRGCGEPG